MKDETLLLITAIICLTILEIVTICVLRIDGLILSGVVAAIVGLALKREEIIRYMGRWRNGNNSKRFSSDR